MFVLFLVNMAGGTEKGKGKGNHLEWLPRCCGAAIIVFL